MMTLFDNSREGRAGYTLVEILIAMVVLMISFLAIIAVETSTLQGYISARDSAAATEMNRRIVDLIEVEGQAWRQQPNQPFGPASGPYASSPFDSTVRPLLTMKNTPWAWHRLFDSPASVNFANSVDSVDLVGGRYCAFVRGGPLGGGTSITQAIQVQVAVVYPGAFGTLDDCTTLSVADLDNTSDAYPGETLEEQGLRVAYSGTVITPR